MSKRKQIDRVNPDAAKISEPPLPSWDELEAECLERGFKDLSRCMKQAKWMTSPKGMDALERRDSRL